MKRIYWAFLLFTPLMINSCYRHGVYGNGEVISINFNKYEQLSLSDIFSKIEVVELEGNKESYLMDPVSLQVINGQYYLKDQHAIFAFAQDGSFLYNTTKRRGRARNEYFSINDYFVSGGDLYILDIDGKILTYDSELNLNNVFYVNKDDALLLTDFTQLNDDVIALSGTDGESIKWIFYSKSKKKVINKFHLSDIITGGYVFGQSRKYDFNDSISIYRMPGNDNTYCSINPNDNTVFEYLCYDFGDKTFSPSMVNEAEKITSYLSKHPREYVLPMETLINNKFILTRMGYLEDLEDPKDGTYRLFFYSKDSGKQRLINEFFNGEKWLLNLDFMDDNCIYSCVTDFLFIDELYDELLLDENSKNILKKANNDTNCLIFKYYFKDDVL